MEINREKKNTIQNIHTLIAQDVYPNGITHVCKVCGREQYDSADMCAYYLAHGWPVCCGDTMRQSKAD